LFHYYFVIAKRRVRYGLVNVSNI